MSAPDTFAMALELPEGAVPDHGVMVVSFFDAEGELRWGLATKGEANQTAVLGLMELAKITMVTGS